MRYHPGPTRREALAAVLVASGQARRFAGAARAACAVAFAETRRCRRRVRATLVGGMGQPALGRQAGHIRCREIGPWRFAAAMRTIVPKVAFRHRPYLGKGAAIGAEIFVSGHRLPLDVSCKFGCGMAFGHTASVRARGTRYLSGDSGRSMPPLICLIGPAALGMISKSKISVGSQSVAQAFGISTTPEIWPCTGAVPRIE